MEWKWKSSVLSDSLRPNVLYSPWNSPGQNTGVGSVSLLQGIFPTQGSGLLHCRQILYQLSHKGSPSSQSYGFSSSHVWMWELDHEEGWAPKNWCFWTVVLENHNSWDSWASLGCKEIQPVHGKGNQSWILKDWCWNRNSNTLATWCEELTHLKRLWCWERMRAGGKGDNRGWDGWMA